MRPVFGAVAFIAVVSWALPSVAATLTAIEGQVSVNRNRGYGFERVTSTVKVDVGDAVMASPGGGAEIVFDDGCRLLVLPGNVEVVPAKSPCDRRSAVKRTETSRPTGSAGPTNTAAPTGSAGPTNAAAPTGSAGPTNTSAPAKNAPAEDFSFSTTTLVVGGVVLGGGVAAAVFLWSGKDGPSSP